MGQQTDFLIRDGVLKKYKGAGGTVVIPEGVEIIVEGTYDIQKPAIGRCPCRKRIITKRKLDLSMRKLFTFYSGFTIITFWEIIPFLRQCML